MTISMIGIDHDRAPVDIRALFADLKYGPVTKKNRKFPCMSVCAV